MRELVGAVIDGLVLGDRSAGGLSDILIGLNRRSLPEDDKLVHLLPKRMIEASLGVLDKEDGQKMLDLFSQHEFTIASVKTLYKSITLTPLSSDVCSTYKQYFHSVAFLQLLSYMLKAAGYSGLVLLLDELESIKTISSRAYRTMGYAHLARLLAIRRPLRAGLDT